MNRTASNKGIASRDSNFELLRIACMFLITLHHFTLTVGINNTSGLTNIWAQLFTIGGKVGVNCFVLIGGYFLCQKKFDVKRVVAVYLQIIFYTYLFLLIGLVFGDNNIGKRNIIQSILPIIFKHYWFCTAYFGLILLSPFINKLIDALDYHSYSCLVLMGLFLFSIIPTFTAQIPFHNDLLWFIYLYVLAGYIRRYQNKIIQILSNIYVFIAGWLLIFLSSLALIYMARYFPAAKEGINFFSGMYILPEFVISLSLFLFFSKRKISSKFINNWGKNTFAIYLIQSNCIIIPYRHIFLNWLVGIFPPVLYPVIALSTSILVVLLFSSFDRVRQWIFDKTKIVTILSDKTMKLLSKLQEGNVYSLWRNHDD